MFIRALLLALAIGNTFLMKVGMQSGGQDILDFEVPWRGGVLSQEHVRSGKYCNKWANHVKNPTFWTKSLAPDWTDYNVLKLWVFSQTANNAKITVIFYSENPDSDGLDYYKFDFKVDWTGWKKLVIPFAACASVRKPVGWKKIDNLAFNAKGWGHEPKKGTILFFDAGEMAYDESYPAVAGAKKSLKKWKKIKIPNLRSLEHPFIVLRKKELKGIREKLKSNDIMKKFYSTLYQEFKLKVQEPLNIPTKGAAWGHLYVCPNDGAHLIYLSPHKHKCPVCGAVYSGEPYDSAALYNIHMYYGKFAYRLGIMYLLSKDKSFADKAKEILLTYADRYLKYELHSTNPAAPELAGRAFAQTLDTAIWAIALTRAYDAIYDTLTPDEKKHIEKDLFKPIVKIIEKNDNSDIKSGNWQSWHNAALLGLGLCLKDKKLVNEVVNGNYGFFSQLANKIYDGMWFEGTWHYHIYAMQAFASFSEIAYNAGMDEVYKGNTEYKKMFTGPIDFAMPDGTMPRLNDSYAIMVDTYPKLFQIAYLRWGDKKFGRLLSKSDAILSYMNLLTSSTKLEDLEKVDFTKGQNLLGADLVVGGAGAVALKTGETLSDSYIAFKYNNFHMGHAHPDLLNFIYWSKGKLLAPGPGTCAYSLKEYQGWYKTSVAHNVVVVNKMKQAFNKRGELVFAHNTPRIKVVEGVDKVSYASEGVKSMKRDLFLNDKYVVVFDYVKSGKDNTYDWVYHNFGKFNTSLPLKKGKLKKGGAGYEYVSSVKRGRIKNNATFLWSTHAGVKSKLTVLGENGTEVITGQGLAPNMPGAPKVDMVIIRRRKQNADFVSVIESYRDKSVIKSITKCPLQTKDGDVFGDGNVGVKIVKDNSIDYYFSTKLKGEKKYNDLNWDGKLISYSLGTAGNPESYVYFVDGAKFISPDIRIALAKKGSVSVWKGKDKGLFLIENLADKKNEITISTKALGTGLKIYKLKKDYSYEKEVTGKIEGDKITLDLDKKGKYEITDGTTSVAKIFGSEVEKKVALDNKTKVSFDYPIDSKLLKPFTDVKKSKEKYEIKVEAENFDKTGGRGKIVVVMKSGASGKAFRGWDFNGQWIEWSVNVKKTGVYKLEFRYATPIAVTRAVLLIDGKLPAKSLNGIMFPYTGGWAEIPNEWMNMVLSDDLGDPYTFYLTAGKHTIRLIKKGKGGTNLDYFKLIYMGE